MKKLPFFEQYSRLNETESYNSPDGLTRQQLSDLLKSSELVSMAFGIYGTEDNRNLKITIKSSVSDQVAGAAHSELVSIMKDAGYRLEKKKYTPRGPKSRGGFFTFNGYHIYEL